MRFDDLTDYTVQDGDTLESVARSILGDTWSRDWVQLYAVNADLIPASGALRSGDKLRVPRVAGTTRQRAPSASARL